VESKVQKLMNNSNSVTCLYSSILDLFSRYLENVLNIFGIIANGLCFIIFIKIVKRRQLHSNMFKYLLMKSLIDCLNFLSNSFQYLFYCSNCRTSSSYLIVVWYIWVYNYFQSITEVGSGIFEIIATFDCFITISSTFKWCQNNLFFYLFTILSILLVSIYLLIYPFGFVISKKIQSNVNTSFTIYFYEYNDFGESSVYSDLAAANAIVRDGVFLIILLSLNLMILISLKKTTERRRILTKNNTNQNLLSASQNAENKKLIMVLAIGLNYTIGHLPYFVWTIMTLFFNDYGTCYYKFVYFVYLMSYADGIFFYFFFNNIFKRFLIGFIPFLNRNN
jgi:hypothetical protein